MSVFLYHLICPAKYRGVVFDERVDLALVEVCHEISLRYEMVFLEIGTDRDLVQFLVQSIPTTSPTQLVRKIKSIKAREIFRRVPEVKKRLWGGEFWSKGYYSSTVGRHGSEETIRQYVKNQEQEFKALHLQQRLLFPQTGSNFDIP